MPISELNSSADFFLPTPPPTENEIYSTDKQEIPTELSNMTNLSKSPDTKSETSVKSDSQGGSSQRLTKQEKAVLGTIISVNESGKEVEVLWDSSSEIETVCTGKDNTFDLLLFDNTQAGVEHTSIICEECDEYPLRGIRWNCLTCDDIDLCSSCYMSNKHDDRNVIEIHKEDGTSYRGDAIVKLENNRIIQHSIGRARDGKCELKVLTKAEGPEYYEDHLPFVSKYYKQNVYCRKPMMNGTFKFNGTIAESSVMIWKKKELKIFDNGPAGIDHDCYCKECSNPVFGMRWQCQKCQIGNDSLCTECYMSDKHIEDLHQFFRIVEPSDRICDGVIDRGMKNIEVMWWPNEVTSLHKIDDLKLKLEKGVKCAYYPDHLPILGKISVDIWYKIENDHGDNPEDDPKDDSEDDHKDDSEDDPEDDSEDDHKDDSEDDPEDERPSYKHILYLIFANHSNLVTTRNEDRFAQMDEVLEFSSRLRLKDKNV
ncbi:MIB [Mytilus edulis]|uniref:MIB n=1 Tax=Mytilus edulis TaxID=6550 RepID=A0A8S3PZ75_MYTED|nr:MIB [Mytilus edulis]